MGRLLAIDYGKKRCGIAVSDLDQVFAFGHDTVPTSDLLDFLIDYTQKEDVEEAKVTEALEKMVKASEDKKKKAASKKEESKEESKEEESKEEASE